MAKILTIFSLLCILAVPAFANKEEEARKRELELLKSKAAEKQNELKKYQVQEQRISKEMSALENRRAAAQRLKNKVASDISYIEQTILSTEDKRAALARSMPMWEGVVLEEFENYLFTPVCAYCKEGYSIEEELFLEQMLNHKAVFASALSKENQLAAQRIHNFEQRNKQLLAQSSKIEQEQKVITTNFQKKKKDLDTTKKRAETVRKEINELNKSAQELDNLLAQFEKKRKADDSKKAAQAAKETGGPKKTPEGPKIDVPAYSLPWPASGAVLSKFGKEYRKDLNTWIFRDGIKIGARPNEAVRTVDSGSVIYAGPFRSYGNVVIMDHGKGFFSIYGFLHTISAKVGDRLEAGATLGAAGVDTQQSSGTGKYAVYFEIRQGTTAVDPEKWLQKK